MPDGWVVQVFVGKRIVGLLFESYGHARSYVDLQGLRPEDWWRIEQWHDGKLVSTET